MPPDWAPEQSPPQKPRQRHLGEFAILGLVITVLAGALAYAWWPV